MRIKSIVIEGVNADVTLERTTSGAMAVANHERICEVHNADDERTLYEAATRVAGLVYGTDRKGRPAATNSMIHEVMDELERVRCF